MDNLNFQGLFVPPLPCIWTNCILFAAQGRSLGLNLSPLMSYYVSQTSYWWRVPWTKRRRGYLMKQPLPKWRKLLSLSTLPEEVRGKEGKPIVQIWLSVCVLIILLTFPTSFPLRYSEHCPHILYVGGVVLLHLQHLPCSYVSSLSSLSPVHCRWLHLLRMLHFTTTTILQLISFPLLDISNFSYILIIQLSLHVNYYRHLFCSHHRYLSDSSWVVYMAMRKDLVVLLLNKNCWICVRL